jgi:hypothetical protein
MRGLAPQWRREVLRGQALGDRWQATVPQSQCDRMATVGDPLALACCAVADMDISTERVLRGSGM